LLLLGAAEGVWLLSATRWLRAGAPAVRERL